MKCEVCRGDFVILAGGGCGRVASVECGWEVGGTAERPGGR